MGKSKGCPLKAMCHTLEKGNPSLLIRGVRWRDEGKKRKKREERKGKKGKRKIIFLVFRLPTRRVEKRERGVRSSTFSIRFTEIVYVGARGKVHLRDKSFA